jgi:hypothetical protein
MKPLWCADNCDTPGYAPYGSTCFRTPIMPIEQISCDDPSKTYQCNAEQGCSCGSNCEATNLERSNREYCQGNGIKSPLFYVAPEKRGTGNLYLGCRDTDGCTCPAGSVSFGDFCEGISITMRGDTCINSEGCSCLVDSSKIQKLSFGQPCLPTCGWLMNCPQGFSCTGGIGRPCTKNTKESLTCDTVTNQLKQCFYAEGCYCNCNPGAGNIPFLGYCP